MTTLEKINYLEKALKKIGCPSSEVTPSALQILNYCRKHNKTVTEIELIK